MKKLILFLQLIFSIGAMADKVVAPDWMDAKNREALYPANKYYTGFATSSVRKGEEKTAVYDRVKQNARVETISSIHMSVEQTVERYMKNTQNGASVSTMDIMTSHAKSHSSIKDVPGLKVDVWENSKKGEVYAFAYIKKNDLSNRLMRRIAVNIGKIDVEVQNVETLIEKGEKIQAKNSLPDLHSMFEDIENDQRVMLSIDASIADDDLLIENVNRLKERCRLLSLELKNGINIYLECKADLFGMNYSTLKSSIQGALSPIGCSFTTNLQQADWIIYVTTFAREYNSVSYGNLVTTYVVSVDADLSIDKASTGQRIYENQISEKGSHTHNYEQAAQQAYKDISPKISAIIKEQIQQ